MYVSFPFNVNEILRKGTVNLGWFKLHRDVVREVYCAPFFADINYRDMNGPPDKLLDTKLLYQLREIGIGVCLTLNDVFHPYPEDTVKELAKHRDLITALVVPDAAWVGALGFDISYRNTVINLPTLEEAASGLYDCYDIIYVHDEIIHNHDKWLAIKGRRKFGCVVNFQECVGYCSHKREHYKLISEGRYKLDAEGAKGCPAQGLGDLLPRMRCSIPEDYREYEYYSDVIDVFKLQGRAQDTIFKNAMGVVEMLSKHQISAAPALWRYKVRNCGGNCPECQWCRRFA